MFKIVRFPEKLESFFSSLSENFLWDHFKYFRIMVLLTAFSWDRRTISNLHRHLDKTKYPHRTRFNNFLNLKRWDPEKALQAKAHEMLRDLKPKKGETVKLIIDSSMKEKYGKKMEAVGWLRDSVKGRTVKGHQYISINIHFRNHTIPLGVRLYAKKELAPNLGIEFKKLTQLAAELIGSFNPPKGIRTYVLFDIYYLCPVVVDACREKGFHFIAPLKSNRNLHKNGRVLKVRSYCKNLFHRKPKQTCSFKKGNRTKQYQYVDAGWLGVSSLGSLHLVVSRRNSERYQIGLVTDDKRLSPKKMIEIYDARWSIEVFFRDAKQLLGLGQYQNGTYRAAVIHLHLVCFAYALLTHLAIQGEKGKTKLPASASTADLQNRLRRIVWDDLRDHLVHSTSKEDIINELDKLLLVA